ncbi:MAG: Gfo/Idh/MocA family oxidoreductase [Thermodesulfobacteria bacterium]|nr:Gfo/Idh/MocA family oxidoreductase [Thermodesulfobacteriota bacterium]
MKVAVIGAGYLGRFHALKYAAMEDVDLVAVVDVDRERAEAVALETASRAYSDYRDVIPQIDAASVVVPTTAHYEVAKNLLEAGVHVMVEKPITTTTEEAQELVDLAEAKGLIMQVGHLERYNPAIVTLMDRVTHPVFIEAHRLSGFKGRATDVDVVLDLMIHDIDIMLSMVKSEIKEIRASGVPVLTPRIDIANVRVIFENGCTANLTASRISLTDLRRIRVFQPGCYLSADCTEKNNLIVTADRNAPDPVSSIRPEYIRHEDADILDLELRDFVKNVREKRRPMVDGRAGMAALDLALRINKAIDEALSQANIKDVWK